MPLKPGRSQKVISENIRELHQGKTYARTLDKYGASRANRQAIAIAYAQARRQK